MRASARVLAVALALPAVAACGMFAAPAPEPSAPGAVVPEDGAPKSADPAFLIGLEARAVHGLLGAPARVRREAPAQVWQYRGSGCVFDVFLYEAGGSATVRYIEARTPDAEAAPAPACLAAVQLASR